MLVSRWAVSKMNPVAVSYTHLCSTYWKEKIAETGKMTLLDHLAEAESCWKKGGNACFLAVEGGAVLAGRLEYVQALAGHGVRMLTLDVYKRQRTCIVLL